MLVQVGCADVEVADNWVLCMMVFRGEEEVIGGRRYVVFSVCLDGV